MSTPAAASPDSAQGNTDQPPEAKKRAQIAFQFCRECSNMLYPKEDRENNTLMFACRTCQFAEPATSSCVFRNQLQNTSGDTAGVTQDIGSDPTLPRSNAHPCPKCKAPEAVFFQSQQRAADTGMKLYYVCCNCGHIWQ